MARRTLTAMYATRDDAEAARRALVDCGLIPQDIDIIDQNDWAEGASGEPVRRDGGEHKGFFRSLKDMLVPDRDREAYAEGLGRGHFLLTAQVDDARHDEAERALERTNAVDLPSSERRPDEQRSLSEQDSDLEYPAVRVRSYSVVIVREVPDEDTDYLRP
ncbi:MAG: hypothetical protein ACM3YN_12450 [Parcubacteria group bacterium]